MFRILCSLFNVYDLLFSAHGSLRPFLLSTSLLNTNAVLRGGLRVGGVKAGRLTGMGGGLAMVC